MIGDLVMVRRGNGLFDRLVRFATVSPYFHCAIVADRGDLIEARMGGVARRPVTEYAGRADILSPVGATQAQREAAVAFCQAKLGQPYGYEDILADALRLGFHIDTAYRWRTWAHMDCSALVANAWATAGLWLTFEPAPTPASLGWSPILSGPRPWAELGATNLGGNL